MARTTSTRTPSFQSTLPARGATTAIGYDPANAVISIHAPRTGSDPTEFVALFTIPNFNPRSPHGERQKGRNGALSLTYFNPRSPHGERLYRNLLMEYIDNFNPRSPHGERLGNNSLLQISIIFQSTLPARGATVMTNAQFSSLRISIHAPRTGSDPCDGGYFAASFAFQSTLPARGATALVNKYGGNKKYFNPRSPHGERRGEQYATTSYVEFQSTLPARGATVENAKYNAYEVISIHAPRTGSDLDCQAFAEYCLNFNPRSPHGERREQFFPVAPTRHFNPRSPHGERHCGGKQCLANARFQSTLPARGATSFRFLFHRHRTISIHAPRTGSDDKTLEYMRVRVHFNPRSPHGERLISVHLASSSYNFNPRSPHGERRQVLVA